MRSRADIEALANEANNSAGQVDVPIDPGAVATYLNLKVVKSNFSEDLSGVLIRKGNSGTIAINESHSPSRQRFTVAHECGHQALGHKGEFFVDKQVINRRDGNSSLAIDEQEIEANQFAASLLMPREHILTLLDYFQETHKSRGVLIEMMAGRFHVSRSAMEYRLMNLGLIAASDD
jgi:Zn-dependent peptidase ImmA (M78 family)